MQKLYIKNIPKGVARANLEKSFEKFEGKVQFFKDKSKFPYAFIEVPETKATEAIGASIVLDGNTLEISKAQKHIK